MPRHLPHTLLTALSVLLIFAVIGFDGTAQARGRRGRGRRGPSAMQRQAAAAMMAQVKAQVAAAKVVLANAIQQGVAAQQKISEFQGKADTASEAYKANKSELEAAKQNLKTIEEQFEGSQSAGSEYGEVRNSYEKARRRLDQVRQQIANSSEYKTRYQQALKSANRGEELSKLRSEAQNDPRYKDALLEYDIYRTKYNQLRQSLLNENDAWVTATQTVRQLQAAESRAKIDLGNALKHRASGKARLREAQKTASAAQATIVRGEAALQQLARSTGNKNYKSSSYNKKR